jgi:hypothetical protein
MPTPTIDLLIDAPDWTAADAFARQLHELNPAITVTMSAGPEILIEAPPPVRYIVRAVVSGVGIDRHALENVLNAALETMPDITIENNDRSEALDMTVVVIP